MNKKEVNKPNDQPLSDQKKKLKSLNIINAALIGFCLGIIFWSLINNTRGLFTLIPIFLIYKLVNNSKK